MVELNARQNGNTGCVVKEFGSFVKKSRIVFIPFQDNPVPLSDPVIAVKIAHDPTDEKGGIHSGVLQHPSNERSCGGLAMCSGDHNLAFTGGRKMIDGLRHGTKSHFSVLHGAHFGVVFGDCIAHYHQVRLRTQMFRIESFK